MITIQYQIWILQFHSNVFPIIINYTAKFKSILYSDIWPSLTWIKSNNALQSVNLLDHDKANNSNQDINIFWHKSGNRKSNFGTCVNLSINSWSNTILMVLLMKFHTYIQTSEIRIFKKTMILKAKLSTMQKLKGFDVHHIL